MDIKTNKLKIGKVRVDLYPKTPDDQKEKAQTVTLRPEPNQSDESKDVARNFLKNVFSDESKYGTGIVSFKLNDPEGWKKKNGDKFIRAIKNSSVNISWTGDPNAIKGLKELLPKGAQANLAQGLGAPGNQLGGQQFGMNPNQGGQPGGGLGQPLGGALGGLGIGQNTAPGIPGTGTNPASQVANYIYDMKKLIKLWEDADHEV